MHATSNRTLRRYILYQVPGWLLCAAIAVLLHRWTSLSAWTALLLVLGWAAKDAALYPFLRHAYEPDAPPAIEQLVGLPGITVEPLAPHGYIRVRGELWRAELSTGAAIGPGHLVTVDAVRGTTLIVRPDERTNSSLVS